MKTCLAGLALILAASAAQADPSAYGCYGLETAAVLPSVEGQDGVFYRVLADLRLRHPMEDAVVQQMSALSAALASRGTTLIYVTVPTKSQAMPQFLPASASDYAFDSKTATLVYDDIVGRLSAAGVLAPDILTALAATADGRPFFAADFHWTAAGARQAAEVIGDLIKAQPAYADLSVAEYRTTEGAPTTAFSTMRRSLQSFCTKALPAVIDTMRQTEVVESAGLGLADIFAGDGDVVPVVLVGTSFSDTPLSNFAGFLSEFSGLDVVNYAVTGGNQFGAITSYLTSRDFAENPPRFLIWENPIYNNLAQYGPDPLEELIAAAGSDCAQPLTITARQDDSLTVDLTGIDIARAAVIRADLGSAGPRQAAFTLTTGAGFTRSAVIERSDRMLASGLFYKPLGSIWHPDLTTVTVTFDRPVTDDASLTLCQ
ncbi:MULTISPECIES: alginate O-acetyltransferase AlgX-related protein [unclassified Yoonia]|uniref:alginate O-acetyltransferase AlgX-related protein n=1 Tax=unclassified Yoonia TaxID=2629118 RepID=UPI002B0022E8|nr:MULTISPECIES: hypothetical protein [unclassified Yoonia]